ncbi:YlxR family protein [Corynebacterium uterequi]|uniref:YlxR family protein n=1 Tax=Corynebacterium uterequi TaxID=1072256 RepID=UPI0009E351E9|nr:YlxR family protein [Corynebacterium uterequi]
MPHPAPIRTCIATRERRPSHELLRVVYDPSLGCVVADPARNMPGRGAWLSPTLDAYQTAESRHAFGRALRISGPVDTGHVRTYLAAHAAGPDIVRKTEA